MALARWQATIVDTSGTVLPGASITVRLESDASLVSLYTDRAGTIPSGNPITADVNGFAYFYVAGGAFRITATSGATTIDWRYVGIGTVSEVDLTDMGAITVDNSGVRMLDANASHGLSVAIGTDLTAERTLTLTTGDADRTLDISAASVTVSAFATTVLDDANAAAALATLTAAGQGKQTIWIPASAMFNNSGASNPPLNLANMTSNLPVSIQTRDFDPVTEEYLFFWIAMPKSWNLGTLTFKYVWSHGATTTNFGVRFVLFANGFGDNESMNVDAGSAAITSDTGGTTNNLYISDESSEMTVSGTLTSGDIVHFRLNRQPSSGDDTLAVDCRIHGLLIYYTTNAVTDA